MKIIYALVFSFLASGLFAQFPVPDQALTFNDQETGYHTKVTDVSGNNHDAYWWTYREGTETMYGKYAPTAGKFGGAWYMSGYHLCCEEMASPSLDFILLAGSKNQKKDAEGFRDSSVIYHGGFEKFTVAFWFKSDRDYSDTNKPCPPKPVEMHEQEILFTFGSGNGFGISNYIGYYEVRLSNSPPEETKTIYKIPYLYIGDGAKDKEWQHLAATFDGTNNGALAVYLDGVLAKAYLNDPNPLETGLSKILPSSGSAEIGAQTGGGQFGDVSDFWGTNAVGKYCITAEDTTYRTGWPAAGYFDDFVFYKDKALDASQINQLYTNGIEALLGGTSVKEVPDNQIQIYPNPAKQYFRVSNRLSNNFNLQLYDVIGSKIWDRQAQNNEVIDVSKLSPGLYFLVIDEQFSTRITIQ